MSKCIVASVANVVGHKTLKVHVTCRYIHPFYGKVMCRKRVRICHNEIDGIVEGDRVEIRACRPVSKTKHWVVVSKIAHKSSKKLESSLGD